MPAFTKRIEQVQDILFTIFLAYSYVSIGEHSCKPVPSAMLSSSSNTASNMLKMLTNTITERMKNDYPDSSTASTPTAPLADGIKKVSSTSSCFSVGAGIEPFSSTSYSFTSDFYGYHSTG